MDKHLLLVHAHPDDESSKGAGTMAKYADEGVRFVGVNVQGGLPPMLLDSTEAALDFVEEYDVTYPTVVDPDGELAKELMDFYGLPQTFFVDHEWVFAGDLFGPDAPDPEPYLMAARLLESTGHNELSLLSLSSADIKHIDLVIPRGGKSLITAVVKDATMPVLKHYDGNCHIYVDAATEGRWGSREVEITDVTIVGADGTPGHVFQSGDAIEVRAP